MVVRSDEKQEQNGIPCAPHFQGAFDILLEAQRYAQGTDSDPWDFAIGIQLLRSLGMSENDLRVLIRLRYIEHGIEIMEGNASGRCVERSNSLSFTCDSCFVLSRTGVDLVAQKLNGHGVLRKPTAVTANERSGSPPIQMSAPIPYWDFQRRTLWFEQKVVKQFRWRAANQERVLAAFQEESWPALILDPLEPSSSCVVKRRLSDTIKCLNRGHKHLLIRFVGDGTGEGVRWVHAG